MTRYPGEATARPSYRLHTLGWRAFEDLALTVMRDILGPTVVSFAEGPDGGRDGAFYGDWNPDPKAPAPFGGEGAGRLVGPFVIQCKFLLNESDTLAPSDIKNEVGKVRRLVAEGICSTYVLMTNARVTAESEKVMRRRLLEAGARHVLVLGGNWIQEVIADSASLRRKIPRLYGLGDLTQVLDERHYSQAHAFLARFGDEGLITFVRTRQYIRAMEHLESNRFVLLEGEAGSGKSACAAALAIGAVDAYGCAVSFIDSPEEFKDAWNPHEPSQLFWVDDAFGAYRFDDRAAGGWARSYGLIRTAIKGGARFIFTSRSYILRAAQGEFKREAREFFDCRVKLSGAALTVGEKEQILYNHLKCGDQPLIFLREIKPHLPEVARSSSFSPEQARRLGSTYLSSGLGGGSERLLLDFFENPVEYLCEVLGGLDQDSLAALCLVYMADGGLTSPVSFTEREMAVVGLLGGTKAGVTQALGRLEGSFLLRVDAQTRPRWRFYHRSLESALAKHIGQNPELVEIFISGLTRKDLITVVDCGIIRDDASETVTIPEVCYGILIGRISELQDRYNLCDLRGFIDFLSSSCSDAFLRKLVESNGSMAGQLVTTQILRFGASGLKLLARLNGAGILPGNVRSAAIAQIFEDSTSLNSDLEFDFYWAETTATANLATADEYEELRNRVLREIIPELVDVLDGSGGSIEWSEAGEGVWQELAQHYEAAVEAYRGAYKDHAEASAGLEWTERAIRAYMYSPGLCGNDFDESVSQDDDTDGDALGCESIFDDLDSG
ncbi:hypothetical protein LN042_19770 [Kitasatospora sp. RB6PN24]|uniref:nSTAND3 domain-containing NTPase n=1 Tax=Kitasatospora humi TaxID=2893891 RepID=UPI001E392C26|nr:hypothetical protein [Kitasatospora humi]MCC9309297.1 hypothetical protein [Kitasatospora humi]